MTTKDELKSFNEFVTQRTSGSDSDLNLSQLFDLWMLQNASESDDAEDVAAVNASIRDFLQGERGTPAGQHSQGLRKEFGV